MEDIKLIKSKLSIPSNTGAVSRKRLEDLILEIENKKALIVSAPAGFGKTTLDSFPMSTLGTHRAVVNPMGIVFNK